MAEFHLGKHGCRKSLAYVTIGTGVGLGLIINRHPVHGLTHPEAGHSRVDIQEADKEFDGTCPFHPRSKLVGSCLEVNKQTTNSNNSPRFRCGVNLILP